MRRSVAVLAALIVLALVPSALAGGGSTSIVVLTGPGSEHARQTGIPLHARGHVVVRFHGDHAAGCEALGTCAYAGTVTWAPPPDGSVNIVQYGAHHRHTDVVLFFATYDANGPAQVPVAQVQRGTTGVCGDVAGSGFDFFDLPVRAGHVDVGVRTDRGDARIETRCPGPLGSDLGRLTSIRRVSVGGLRRGRVALDLSGTHSFKRRGFAGSIESTVTLELGSPRRVNSGPPPHERTRVRHVRYITSRYAVERLSGVEQIAFWGLADPLCGPFDSCGAAGAIALSPSARKGDLTVVAEAPASRPRRDLFAAIGLAAQGRRSGVETYGYGRWVSDGGVTTARVGRADGSPPCTDTAGLRTGLLDFARRGSSLRLAYASPYGEPDALRTRCPGPVKTDLSEFGTLAVGRSPLAVLRHRRVVIHLDRRRSFRGDGYAGTVVPDLTLVLRRTSVRERVVVERIPIFP